MNFERNFSNNFSPENKNRYRDEDPQENLTRREFLEKTLSLAAGAAAMFFLGPKIFEKIRDEKKLLEKEKGRIDIDRYQLKKLCPDLNYEEIYKEPVIEGLVLPGKLNESGYLEGSRRDILDGKIIRSLRYKNITDAVETKYNLPSNILLAMIAQESYGYNPLLNALGDGGAGLCHMQGITATEFGLKTYKHCNALICDGQSKYSCIDLNGNKLNHGEALKKLIQEKDNDIKKLIDDDDRFHPVINIDAACRMIAFHLAGSQRSGIGPLETAMKRYSGRDEYWPEIKKLIDYFQDKTYLKEVEKKFNLLNLNTRMNSRKINFSEYLEESQKQNLNYQLTKYQYSSRYRPKNSDKVLKVLLVN